MEKTSLTSLLRQNTVERIEKHLVFHYLKSNQMVAAKSPFISQYLEDFEPDTLLLNDVEKLGHETLAEIAVDFELLIPASDKKVNGAFFTPAYIVDFIIDNVNPSSDSTFIDISCGSGAFILGVVRYMQKHFGKSIVDIVKENVFGVDLLEYNVKRAKLLLSLMALQNGETLAFDDINIICDNSLTHNFERKYDFVIGNPPYVKFQDMDDHNRDFLLSNFETTKFGTFNLYFAFFEIGLKILNDNGKLGYITPNNYFTSLAGECLRDYFQRTQSIYKIVDFNATKVFDVQTYTSITFLNKHKNNGIQYGRIANNEEPEAYLTHVGYSENLYKDLVVKKWRLLCGDERKNIGIIETVGESIGSLFNICVGIATLKDEVYFIDPIKEDEKYYFIEKSIGCYKIEKEITRPLVKISDMKKQEDISNNTRRIIFPYLSIKGKAQPIEETQMKERYPECYRYFLSVAEILKGRGKGKHVYTPFYAYGRTQGLNRTGIKLLTPTFSKVPRFLLDQNDDGFFTNGYGVYLIENSELFKSNIATLQNLDVIQMILNSVIMQYYVEKTSVAIEGGYPCYQKNFIERFTIPEFSDKEIKEIRRKKNKKEIDAYLINKYNLNLSLSDFEYE